MPNHETIRDHHEELFYLTTTLDSALHHAKPHKPLAHIITFLEDYVVTHFEAEELLMRQHQFSGYEAHHNAHQAFKDRVALLRPLLSNNAFTHLMFRIRRLTDDLIIHIQTVDKHLLDLR